MTLKRTQAEMDDLTRERDEALAQLDEVRRAGLRAMRLPDDAATIDVPKFIANLLNSLGNEGSADADPYCLPDADGKITCPHCRVVMYDRERE
jgi:hypothetical protein